MAANSDKLVLVVDDDEGVRELLALLILKAGYRVAVAEDGAVAQTKALELSPALIVLDLMLPRYGGFEVLKWMQGNALARTPTIVITGRYTDRTTSDLIRQEANVVELLEKPIRTPRFLQALHRVLSPAPDAGKVGEI
jgi:CheY-like chemotaxis protein